MEKKEMTGFQGIFFDEINKKKLMIYKKEN